MNQKIARAGILTAAVLLTERRVMTLAIDYHGEDLATALLPQEFCVRDASAPAEHLGG